MGIRAGERTTGPKCIAIVGPYSCGKTTLLEAILARTGAIPRPGSVGAGSSVGDSSAEARSHQMSVEAAVATTEFMGDSFTFIDCPGSIEFASEADFVAPAADLAVVGVEADPKKIPALQLVMRRLEDLGMPRLLFLNKLDRFEGSVRDALKLLQPASATPLLLRQIPLRKDAAVVGSIDLALERAYIYRQHAESEIVAIPDEEKAREIEARFSMLETLADHDDHLMEQLLTDVAPPRDEVLDDLTADLREGNVTPVLIGSAERGNGVLRLLKALRHEAPGIEVTAKRVGIPAGNGFAAHVMKTIHSGHGGKLSVVRVLSGQVADGVEVVSSSGSAARVSGVYALLGRDTRKLGSASAGDTVALGKLEGVRTGDALGAGKGAVEAMFAAPERGPVFSLALRPRERKDEVKLSSALQKLGEEDPSLALTHSQETGETILAGHGEMHLRVTVERLEGRYQIPVEVQNPTVPYRETVRKPVQKRGRHKKQSGGHGQFGDVVLEIKPQPRGSGFAFTDTITGGVVPKQYIQSVETGVRDYLRSGPFGFPVVDVAVNLSDGSYHTVDSSDMAFQMAAKLAMKEAMAEASPLLLEPVMRVQIVTPTEATPKITALIPQRRGQIIGFDARPGWPGWDTVEATIPQAALGDLIIELRSATAGVASYTAVFDHMAELAGRLADEAISTRRQAA